MYVPEDICSVGELCVDAEKLVAKARETRRPIVITLAGEPAAILLSTELFPTKETALKAACELATTSP